MTEPSYDSSTPYADAPWCLLLRNASSQHAITRKQLHEQSGIYMAKVVAILSGRSEPTADDLLRMSGPLRLSPLLLLDAAGHLPGSSNIVAYVEQLEEQVLETANRRSSLSNASYSAAAAIAGKAAESGRFRVTIIPVWFDTGTVPLHYAEFVALDPIDPEERPNREDIEAVVGNELAWYGAGFLGIPAEAREAPTPDQSTVINVPRFVAPRRNHGNPLRGGPGSICVLGGHWSGSADVASFLGYAFDYDYAHVGFVASRTFSRLSHQWDHHLFSIDRKEVARAFTVGSDLGRPRVWAVGGEGCLDATQLLMQEHRQRTPFVLHLRVSDRLIEWTARLRVRWHHTDATVEQDVSDSRRERDGCDRILTRPELRGRTHTIDIDLPPGRAPDDPDKETGNDFFRVWHEAAHYALSELEGRGHRFDLELARRAMDDVGRNNGA